MRSDNYNLVESVMTQIRREDAEREAQRERQRRHRVRLLARQRLLRAEAERLAAKYHGRVES